MTEEEKQKLFIFLKKCEERKLTFVETIKALDYTGSVSLEEALQVIEEYRSKKHEGKEVL